MIRFRSVWMTLVGSGVAIALVFGVVLQSPARSLYPALASTPVGVTQPDSAQPLPATVRHAAIYGDGLKRTLSLLASSTPTHRHTVRILFYGQSITKQDWWLEVVDALRQRFPNANLIVENRAIGGFSSPYLVRAAEHDLYSFYPDLLIFQVYGDEQNYEKILANTRQRTTTEIALVSDHIDWLPGEPAAHPEAALHAYRWHNQHVQWLGTMAEKYGAELIDIRTPWEAYLKSNQLTSTDLQIPNDGHLNDRGNRLMAKLITEHLLQSPIPSVPPKSSRIQDYPASTLRWQNGKLKLTFQGNRVDLVTRQNAPANLASATVLIDGKRPSQFPQLYHLTRPSDAFHVDVPGIIQVKSQAPLQLEDWSLVVTAANPAMTEFKFQVYGSKTGFDGEGISTQPFVSRSQRIVIHPAEWHLAAMAQTFNRPVPPGFQIRWSVIPLFHDVYVPPTVTDPTREVSTTLAQNLPNTRHVLELLTNSGQSLPFDAIRVYRPDGRVARID